MESDKKCPVTSLYKNGKHALFIYLPDAEYLVALP